MGSSFRFGRSLTGGSATGTVVFVGPDWDTPVTVTVDGVQDGDYLDGDAAYEISLLSTCKDANFESLSAQVNLFGMNCHSFIEEELVGRSGRTVSMLTVCLSSSF